MSSKELFANIPTSIRKPGLYRQVGGADDQPIPLTNIAMMTRRGHTITYWTPVSEGGLDDETTVLMALSDYEVAEGYRFDGQWFYTSDHPTNEIPTHWADLPRHPMDTAP